MLLAPEDIKQKQNERTNPICQISRLWCKQVWQSHGPVYVQVHGQRCEGVRAQELCESQDGRPGLPVLASRMVSMDVKQYWTMLTHCP